LPPFKQRLTTSYLNFVSYFAMKNTPKVGSVSNFWGAVQQAGFLFFDSVSFWPIVDCS